MMYFNIESLVSSCHPNCRCFLTLDALDDGTCFILNGKKYDDVEYLEEDYQMRPMSQRTKEIEAGSWKGHWMVPIEARIRPVRGKHPKKDKSWKINSRKLRQRKARVPNKFGRNHAKR